MENMKITIRPKSTEPIYIQIYDSIVALIASGELVPGDSMPSTRNLAKDLGINYITVDKAYSLLESEGFIKTEKRRVKVILPSEDSKKEFVKRWRNTEYMMMIEAKAKRLTEVEIKALFIEFARSFQ